MLTYEDCVEFCDLTEEEVAAISEHEHVPAIVAAEMGNYLVHSEDGIPMIRRFILDDIEDAKARGDKARAETLDLVLKHFIASHAPDR